MAMPNPIPGKGDRQEAEPTLWVIVGAVVALISGNTQELARLATAALSRLPARAFYAVLFSGSLLAVFALIQLLAVTGPGDFFAVLSAASWSELALMAVSADTVVKFLVVLFALLLVGYLVYTVYLLAGVVAGSLLYLADRCGALALYLAGCADALAPGYYRLEWTGRAAARVVAWARRPRHVTHAAFGLAVTAVLVFSGVLVTQQSHGYKLPGFEPPAVTLCFPGNQCQAIAAKRLLETQDTFFGVRLDGKAHGVTSSPCMLPSSPDTTTKVARFARSEIKAVLPGEGAAQMQICTAMFGRGDEMAKIADDLHQIRKAMTERSWPPASGQSADPRVAELLAHLVALERDSPVVPLLNSLNRGVQALRWSIERRDTRATQPGTVLEETTQALVRIAERLEQMPEGGTLAVWLGGIDAELAELRALVQGTIIDRPSLTGDRPRRSVDVTPPDPLPVKPKAVWPCPGEPPDCVAPTAPMVSLHIHYVVANDGQSAGWNCRAGSFSGLEIAFAQGSHEYEPRMRPPGRSNAPMTNAAKLDKIVATIRQLQKDQRGPPDDFLLLGEASAEGGPARNLWLSQRRASAVCGLLKAQLRNDPEVTCDVPTKASAEPGPPQGRKPIRMIAVPLGEGREYANDSPASTDRRRVRVLACYRQPPGDGISSLPPPGTDPQPAR
jgi:hypothetical protein